MVSRCAWNGRGIGGICVAMLAGGTAWMIGVPAAAQSAPSEPPQGDTIQSEASTAAAASAETPLITPSPWRFELTATAWLAGYDGEVGVRGRSASVNATVFDIVDSSDSVIAVGGRFELGREKFGAFADGYYAKLSVNDVTGPAGQVRVDVTSVQTILDFGLMYRLVDRRPEGEAGQNSRRLTFDLYAGGRYSDIEVELIGENIDRSRNESWVDPIIGGKLVLPFTERWHLLVSGDVGGFGVESDFTWATTAAVGYDFHMFSLPASVLVGYRAIGWDYTTGEGADNFQWDIIQHGMLLGLSLRF